LSDDRLRQMLLGTPAAGFIAACQAVRDVDQRHLLGKIAVPTLIINGKHDPATPPEHGHYLRDHIPGARMVELEAAHIANIEAAAAFDAALIGFLRETPGNQ
jgi:3-oxoadipate enol-lactonase